MMKPAEGSFSKRIILVIGLTILFTGSIFKNLSYPLFWSDEADTAIYGQQVLKYGLPTIHDEKNYIYNGDPYSLRIIHDNKEVSVFNGWAIYYWAALAVKFAGATQDIYAKTVIIRGMFSVLGILGIIILPLLVLGAFRKHLRLFWLMVSVYLLLEICSTSLSLHLRQARYYPMVILWVNLILALYIRQVMIKPLGTTTYMILQVLLLVVLYNTFFPVFYLVIAGLLVFEVLLLVMRFPYQYQPGAWQETAHLTLKDRLTALVGRSWVLGLAFLFCIPLGQFYKVSVITDKMSTQLGFDSAQYLVNLQDIMTFFVKQEFLLLAICLKILAFASWMKWPANRDLFAHRIRAMATLLLLIVVVSILGMARSPYLYERMYIYLQPLLMLMMLLDAALIYTMPGKERKTVWGKKLQFGAAIFAALLVMQSLWFKAPHWKGYWHELTHRYKGTLDYIIPFIQSHYKNPEKLIIATNYEEFTYMFYLGCRTIIGYINRPNSLQENPDIVVYRKGRGQNENSTTFDNILQRDQYKRIGFPVFDNLVNNIPQLYPSDKFPEHHLYQTRLATSAREETNIFVDYALNISPGRDVEVGRDPALSVMPPSRQKMIDKKIGRIRYSLDSFNETDLHLEIRGWAYVPGADHEKKPVHLYLEREDTAIYIPMIPVNRPDIRRSHPDLETDAVGFKGYIVKHLIPPGLYQVGLYVDHEGGIVHHLNRYVQITEISMDRFRPSATGRRVIRYAIDQFEDNYFYISMSGWVHPEGSVNAATDSTFILLSSDDNNYYYYLDPLKRADLAGEPMENAGFMSNIYKKDMKEGLYNIGFYFVPQNGRPVVQYLPYNIVIKKKMVSPRVKLELPKESAPMNLSIDKFTDPDKAAEVMGWAYLKGFDAAGSRIFIYLRSSVRNYAFEPTPVARPDVTKIYQRHNLDESGFAGLIDKTALEPGKYQVGIVIVNTRLGKNAVAFTEHIINVKSP